MFELKIKTGNAAFCDPYTGEPDEICEAEEVERILYKVIRAISHSGNRSGKCMDENGNEVGRWSFN
jgi:hypothetical protein